MFRSSKVNPIYNSSLKEISSLLNDISMRIFREEQKLDETEDTNNQKKITNRIGYLRMCEYYLRNMDYALEDLNAQLQTAPDDIKKLYAKISKFTDEDKQKSIQLFDHKGYFKSGF